MKKLLMTLMALLMLLPAAAVCEAMQQPLYRAKMAKESKMRDEPSTSAKFLGTVPDGAEIVIYEWDEEWSLCGYGEKTGYLLTNRFYELWRLGSAALPGMQFLDGVATITREVHMENEDKSSGDLFNGIDLMPGDVIAACSEAGDIPFRRAILTLPEDSYEFAPFAAPETAAPGEMLYAFTTYYNDSVGGDLAAERRYNIELAAQRLSGQVLAAGEQFSYNEVCGPYEVSNGYVRAPNISRTGYGVGGGVCQLSTTLFEAILGLELQLDQWEVHQTSGVKYAPLNYDAAVGSVKDLRFTNTLGVPIRIEVRTQRGALTVYLYRAE